MSKLISAQAIAAVALAATLPLAASANSAAEEQAFERTNQPQATQTHYSETAKKQSHVGEGQSAAMANALEHAQDTPASRDVASDNGNNALNWSGQSDAAADALRRVNQTDAS